MEHWEDDQLPSARWCERSWKETKMTNEKDQRTSTHGHGRVGNGISGNVYVSTP